jgi:histidyl-tRNA synthetase
LEFVILEFGISLEFGIWNLEFPPKAASFHIPPHTMSTFQTLPGFREFHPDALARRNHIFRLWRRTANAFAFSEYDAPVLEPLDLYKTKSGDEIENQLFSFTDKGGREVALRPEMTPTICRLVGEKAPTLKRPIKWFSIAEFYRYERMQKGRGRCFHQFNADIFGEPGIEAETELIALLAQSLTAFGLTADDFYIRLSDRNLWFYYLEALGLTDPQTRAILTAVDKYEKLGDAAFKPYADQFGAPLNETIKKKILRFLQIKSLDALEAALAAEFSILDPRFSIEGAAAPNTAPQSGASLGAREARSAAAAGGPIQNRESKIENPLLSRLRDWKSLLANLTALGLSDYITVDLGVVRGLAYYTGFVFEAYDRKGELRALAGGGRYDNLVAKLGYADLPAAGFAIGDMTMSLLLDQRALMPPLLQLPDIYVIIGGPQERLAAVADIHALRASGHRVEYPLHNISFGKQFKQAAESGAKLALIYGSDELSKNVIKIRDLRTRTEQDIPRPHLHATVQDFLSA